MKPLATNKHRKNNSQSNEFYLNALKTQSSQAIEEIYNDHFDLVKNLIIKLGGETSDARDLFQEALIVIYHKVQTDSLQLSCTFRTYLCSICRNLWLRSLRNSGRSVSMDDLTKVPEEFIEDEAKTLMGERKQLLYSKLRQLANDEQKVLRFFFEGVKMKEIARLMGYASEGYAKKKKNICKNKLVALMQSDMMFGELSY